MVISVVLDRRRANKEEKFPIKLRIYNAGKAVLIPLNMYADLLEFDEEAGLFLIAGKKDRSEKILNNSKIATELEKAEALYIDLRRKGQENISPTKFKEMLSRGDAQTAITLNDHFRRFIGLKQGRTAEIYEATLNKIERLFGKEIYFEDVTYTWLETFDDKMRKERLLNAKGEVLKIGLETNARSIHFRNIRAVFNNAIDNEIIQLNVYPFRRFKIKREATVKRAMEVENLRRLFAYEGSEPENWARDVAKLIFFLIGINVKDLYGLGVDYGKSIDYKRAKTGRVYAIAIEPETKKLLDQFTGESSFTFSQFQMYQSFGKKVNKYLSDICEAIKIPKITTYSLRHTWATVAAELDIPKETISEALGHSSGKTITDVYIKFNKSKIDEANRAVMDFVLCKKKPKNKKR